MAHPLQVASARRADIDWLRVLTVFLLIPYHTARVFDVFEPNYAKNWELSCRPSSSSWATTWSNGRPAWR